MQAGSEQAAPPYVAHDSREAEHAHDESDAVDLPKLPHVVRDSMWQNQILPKNACIHQEACSTQHMPGNAQHRRQTLLRKECALREERVSFVLNTCVNSRLAST